MDRIFSLPQLDAGLNVVAQGHYESLKETAYLLRSPENARRLLASIDRLEAGRGNVRDLVE
jgi:antitoxin YefM